MWIWRYNRSRLISFVFSCKNDQEKVRSWFTKVVLFFTKNPTKFSLYFSEFSTFFYEFSMFQPKPKYYLRSYFACRPLEVSFLLWIGARFANKTLERSRCSQCSPWAWRAARPAKIPVIWRRSRPRKGRRGGLGLTDNRFVADVGVGAAPEAECGGAGRWSVAPANMMAWLGLPTTWEALWAR
jgi:hypothetical protein